MGIVCNLHGYDHSLLGDKCDPNKVRQDRLVVTLQSNVVTVTQRNAEPRNVTVRNAKHVTRNAVDVINVTPAKPLVPQPLSSAARQKAYRARLKATQS